MPFLSLLQSICDVKAAAAVQYQFSKVWWQRLCVWAVTTLHWKPSLFCKAQVTTSAAVSVDFMDRVLIHNGSVF